MTISLIHKFQSAKADGADNSIVQPSDWNDNHELTLAASRLLGRASGTSGAVEEVALGSGLSFSGATLKAEVAADMATKATPVDADSLLLTDSAASNAHKKLTWANLKATLKTYFDTLYSAVGHVHTFGSLTSKPTTVAGYGITDIPTPNYGAGNAALAYGAVGTYVFGWIYNAGITNNSTYAGSSIQPAGVMSLATAAAPDDGTIGASINKGGFALSGTWRAMGRVNSNSGANYNRITLFLRIS